jgi:hypothetical protein
VKKLKPKRSVDVRVGGVCASGVVRLGDSAHPDSAKW